MKRKLCFVALIALIGVSCLFNSCDITDDITGGTIVLTNTSDSSVSVYIEKENGSYAGMLSVPGSEKKEWATSEDGTYIVKTGSFGSYRQTARLYGGGTVNLYVSVHD
jgi:hypothetical protein